MFVRHSLLEVHSEMRLHSQLVPTAFMICNSEEYSI